MKLAELCLSHRGARLVQSLGLSPRFLEAASGLARATDPMFRAAAGCIIYALGALGGDPTCMSTETALGVVGYLITPEEARGTNGVDTPKTGSTLPGQDVETRLKKLLLSRVVQPGAMPESLIEDAALSAEALALLVLEAATSTASSSASAAVLSGEVKAKLDSCGVLEGTAALLKRNIGQSGLQDSWVGVKALKVLENSTFLHHGNAEFLAGLPFVSQLLTAAAHWPRPEQKAALLFLLNITHESAAGCRAVCSGAGLSVLVELFLEVGGRTADLGEDGAHEFELVNLLLGLLINVAEKDDKLRSSLMCRCRSEAAMPLGRTSGTGGLLDILSRLIFAGQRTAQKVTEEVTADMVTTSEAKGESSINRAYASILLGFIVCDEPQMKDVVSHFLPGKSLNSLVDALDEFSRFLNSVHAVTDSQAQTLCKLLAKLRG